MQETEKSTRTGRSGKTPERGTAEAALKERGKPAPPEREGAASRGKEPITEQNRTSSEE